MAPARANNLLTTVSNLFLQLVELADIIEPLKCEEEGPMEALVGLLS